MAWKEACRSKLGRVGFASATAASVGLVEMWGDASRVAVVDVEPVVAGEAAGSPDRDTRPGLVGAGVAGVEASSAAVEGTCGSGGGVVDDSGSWSSPLPAGLKAARSP